MLRRLKNASGVLMCVLFLGCSQTGMAQTTPPPPPPGSQQSAIEAFVTATQAGITPGQATGLDSEAIRRAIEQMDEMVRVGTEKAVNVRPVFDGRNWIFNVNGVTYTFDITSPAIEAASSMTTLEVSPRAPHAHEDAKITVNNFSTNLVEDRITWAVNNAVVQDQIGGTSIQFRMGDIGEPVRIAVTIFSRSLKDILTKEIVLAPGDVAVLWEANTYTPPFYKGKPLPSYRSTVKLIPFPTILVGGRTVPPENLLYQWTRNYRNVPELSGYGKRFSILETGGGAQKERLKLTVSHPDSGGGTEREITINVIKPKVLLYAGSPLQGIRYEQALGKTFTLGTQETTIKGEPFFFSNEELENGTSPLEWTQNGKNIPSLYRSVVLQKPEVTGSSHIEALVKNPKRVLQFSQAGITINYQGN